MLNAVQFFACFLLSVGFPGVADVWYMSGCIIAAEVQAGSHDGNPSRRVQLSCDVQVENQSVGKRKATEEHKYIFHILLCCTLLLLVSGKGKHYICMLSL